MLDGMQSGAVDTSEIVIGLGNRDAALIGKLIDEYGGRLLRYLLLLTGNYHTAEDIFQETWVRVLERGYQYKGTYGFQAWLFSIARHLVIDLSRHKKAVSLEEMTSDGMRFEPLPETTVSPLDRLCYEERETQLETQVRRLPRRHREVFMLRFGDEMKLAEIAKVTRVPLSTVKSRLYRAASVLQARLTSGRRVQASALGQVGVLPALQEPECLSAV